MQRGETWGGGRERADPDELNAAQVRLLIADDLHIEEWFVKSRLHVALRALQRTLERKASRGRGDL